MLPVLIVLNATYGKNINLKNTLSGGFISLSVVLYKRTFGVTDLCDTVKHHQFSSLPHVLLILIIPTLSVWQLVIGPLANSDTIE